MENITKITADHNIANYFNVRKLWKYRAIIITLTKRDIKSQYAQTKFGIVWPFIQAITAALIMNLFFSILLGVNSDVPFLLYAFPGMMAWYYFSFIVNYSGLSIIHTEHIIKKIYFPKIALPIYKTLVGLIEHLIWFVVYIGILIYYSQPISLNMLFFPICILVTIFTGFAIAIWLCALSIKNRDIMHIIPYLIAFGIFVTPVFFQTTIIPENFKFFLYLNPMSGAIALYRWTFLNMPFDIKYLYGFGIIAVLLLTGLFYFKKTEYLIADNI